MEILNHSTHINSTKIQESTSISNKQRQNEDGIVYDLDIDVFEGHNEGSNGEENYAKPISATCSCTCQASCPYC